MPNPIFVIIEKNAAIQKMKEFKIALKKSEDNEKYFLFAMSSKNKKPEFQIDGNSYSLVESHITVFDDLKKEEGNGKSAYHLTAKLVARQKELTIRAYFSTAGNLLYVNCRDKTEKLISVQLNDGVTDFIYQATSGFIQAISNVYSTMDQEYAAQHHSYMESLTQKSLLLANPAPEKLDSVLKEYQEQLTKTVNHLKQWHQFKINPDKDLLTHLTHREQGIKERRKSTQNIDAPKTGAKLLVEEKTTCAEVVVESKTDAPVKQDRDFDRELKAIQVDEKLSSIAQIVAEYHLWSEIMSQESDAAKFLAAAAARGKAAKQAHAKLVSLILPKAVDVKYALDDLRALISIDQAITLSDFRLAVISERNQVLQIMLDVHAERVNLNALYAKSGAKKQYTLLEEAYTCKNLEGFKLLLAAGVNPDLRLNELRETLLMLACRDGRKEEMIALLKAGASQYIKSRAGFSSLGYLTLSENGYDIEMVQAFLDNCTNCLIDYCQGYAHGSTALTYSCQKNREPLVVLLLQRGANPNLCRTTDHHSALGIAVAKDHESLVTLIINTSKFPIELGVAASAIRLAEAFGKKRCLQILLDHFPNAKDCTMTALFPLGTPISALPKKTRELPARYTAEAEMHEKGIATAHL